jgi:hypothetical protein
MEFLAMKIIQQKAIKHWWVTASLNNPSHGWSWSLFFRNPRDKRQNFNWGGPKWINSNISFARIKRMTKGDIVIAYQASKGVVGLARLGSNGYKSAIDLNYDTFDLSPKPTIWLKNPVPYSVIRALPDVENENEFVKIKRGTVFAVTKKGFDQIFHLILAFNPDLEGKITQFLNFTSA